MQELMQPADLVAIMAAIIWSADRLKETDEPRIKAAVETAAKLMQESATAMRAT
jgi:hypothetical protein